ncbi:hypothetical protein NQ318_017132 [Aromia moschata]|uniref:HTH CENPB-type domain-containing protein n=1 Tax=Aromia moschata TaxID=1265417 RepID=A0AAV8X6V2_9CUCU|nr:hypothetical protein NQ318_017132 [Aromia moschata]
MFNSKLLRLSVSKITRNMTSNSCNRVLIDKVGQVTTIGINRPEKRNCVDHNTAAQIRNAIEDFEQDDASYAAVLYGTGGNFCSGFDLKELANLENNPEMEHLLQNGLMGLASKHVKKPMVAAINGYAVAGGLELALMCDLRVMEDTAVIGLYGRRFEKLQVIEYFKNGMKNKDLSEKYKVHHSAISKIIHNKDKILQHKESMEKYGANKNVLRYSSVHVSLFEKCTFLWFCEKRALGEPVTGLVLKAKAKQFHASLTVDSNFSASNGWLARFKKRHGIRCLNIKGEKLSANEDDANVFREGLKAFLENHGYKLDNIFNGDETSLFWKHFPTKTFVCRNETEAPGIPLTDGATVRLQATIGLSRALDMILTGRSLGAKEAFEWGVANRIVACGTALGQAINLASSLVKFPQECLLVDRDSTYCAAYNKVYDELSKCAGKDRKKLIKEAIEGAKKFISGLGRHGKTYNLTERSICDWEKEFSQGARATTPKSKL